MAYAITLQTSDSGVNPGDKIGILGYAASNESSGSDAITIAASIHAEAESEFTASSNKTCLVFSTSADGNNDLDPKLKICSSGHFVPTIDNVRDLGASGLRFRNLYANYGNFNSLLVNNIPVALSGAVYPSNKGFVNIDDDTTTYVSISGGYTIGSLDIFLNGVKLLLGTDYTASDGSGIIFSSSPESGSVIEYLSLYPTTSLTASHPTINAATSVDNSNNIFVQDILLDQYGHITGVVSASVSGSLASSETDPIFTGSVAYNITVSDTGNWNSAYGWGDHSIAGYATTGELISVSGYLQNQIDNVVVSETDPIFTGSAAYNITITDTGNWTQAYLWGNHATQGYATESGLISVSGYLQSQIDNIDDIYLTGVSFNTSSRDLTFSWNQTLPNISVNIPSSGTGGTHPTINAASSSDNSGRTYIQDILLDEYGHVTGIATATETVVGSGTGVLDASGIYDVLSPGTGISIAYSSGNNNITISATGPNIGLVYFLH